MSIEVTVERDPESLRQEWQDLVADCANKEAYVQPFFLLQWIKEVENRWSPEVVVARRNGVLEGLLPLGRRSVLGCRIIGFPVSGSTPPMDLIVRRDAETEVAIAIAQFLHKNGGWDLLHLHKVDLSKTSSVALAKALEATGDCTMPNAGSTFVVDLTRQANYADFMQELPRRFRKEVERWTRRHRDMGEVKTRKCPGDISLPEAMDVVETILNLSWKGSDDEDGTIGRLRRLSAAALEEDKLQVLLKFVDDTPTSFLVSFVHDDVLFPFHITYDLNLNQIGPGQVQLSLAIQEAYEKGIKKIDFGGGFSYLRKWATGTREFQEVRVVRNSIRSRLLAGAYLKRKDERHAKALEDVEKMKQQRKDEAKQSAGPQS